MRTFSIAGTAGNKLLTCISVHRILKKGSVLLVSVLTNLDCTRFATAPITFTRLEFHQQIPDYKPVITRYLAAFLDECQIYLGEKASSPYPPPPFNKVDFSSKSLRLTCRGFKNRSHPNKDSETRYEEA